MIEAINIKNFRCFSEIDIIGIKPLTIISGKNNIGKSSVLEALFFMYDHSNGTPFLKMNRLRGELANRSIYNTWESVFHNMNTDVPIEIDARINGIDSKLTYTKESMALLNFSKDVDKSMQTVDYLSNMASYALKMTYEKGDYIEEADYVYVAGIDHTQMVRDASYKHNGEEVAKEPMGDMVYLSNGTVRDDAGLIDLFSTLEMNNGKDKLLKILRIIDRDIDDVSLLSSNGVVQLYVKKNGLTMPFRYAGDGIMKLLDISLRLLAMPGCVILVDEIENGLHYSCLEEMWTVISEAAKINNCQIIATTHSYESITASTLGAKNSGREKEYSYIRLEKRNENNIALYYDYEDMSEAIEAELEVR
ncbi:MAG: hypothetical protein E7302_00785 [Butyrivibrio sp.]|nr:hypothetical protein [Butyrivibrio sp.]